MPIPPFATGRGDERAARRRPHGRRVRRCAAGLLAVAALAGPAVPAAASRGGEASADGVTAVAGELTLDVTTSGAVGALGPVVDRLTAGPVVRGRQVDAVHARTPPEPSGREADSLGPVELGSLLAVEAVTAGTERVENGVLSAESGVGGGRVDLLGIRVLDVGPVTSRVTTHPDEPPTATAAVSGLEVFGSPVTLPEGQAVDLSLALGTDQVLELVEQLAPALGAATGFLARVASATGTVDVVLHSETAVDPATGAARAAGLTGEVRLRLNLSLCVPELRGDGCLGAVAVSADARVLDLRLAESEVRRPDAVDTGGAAAWWLAFGVLGIVLVAAVSWVVARRWRAGGTAVAPPRRGGEPPHDR